MKSIALLGLMLMSCACLAQDLAEMVTQMKFEPSEHKLALEAAKAARDMKLPVIKQMISQRPDASTNFRAFLSFLSCSADSRHHDRTWATACLNGVAKDYPGSPAAEVSTAAAGAIQARVPGLSASDQELDSIKQLVAKVNMDGVPPELAVKLGSYLDSHRNDASIVPTVFGIADAIKGKGQERYALRLLDRLWKDHDAAKEDPMLAAIYAELLNLEGRPDEALAAVGLFDHKPVPDGALVRLEFSRTIALRDLHRMKEAQASLDRVQQVASRTNDQAMLGIAKDLRSPGHSMDQSLRHEVDIRPTESTRQRIPVIQYGFGALLCVAGCAIWISSKRKRFSR